MTTPVDAMLRMHRPRLISHLNGYRALAHRELVEMPLPLFRWYCANYTLNLADAGRQYVYKLVPRAMQ